MNNVIVVGIIGLLVGLGGGYFFATDGSTEKKDGHHMDEAMHMEEDDHHDHAHAHTDLKVAADIAEPKVAIQVVEDTVDGYNVQILTENFTFAPENVNGEPTQGEGHAHIFVNGMKVARVYGDWFHIDGKHFKEGENMINVTLNANDHSEWVLQDGTHVSASTMVMK